MKENWVVLCWTDRTHGSLCKANRYEFKSQDEALRFIMKLSPYFRVHLDVEEKRV